MAHVRTRLARGEKLDPYSLALVTLTPNDPIDRSIVRRCVACGNGLRRWQHCRCKRRHATDEFAWRRGATKLGIPFETYRGHVEAGEKWCTGCRGWHDRSAFGVCQSARDGLNQLCRAGVRARNEQQRSARLDARNGRGR